MLSRRNFLVTTSALTTAAQVTSIRAADDKPIRVALIGCSGRGTGTSRPGYPREAGESELHYQIRDWYFFTWMSGDHILEQHRHNLDVANWVLKGEMPMVGIRLQFPVIRNRFKDNTAQ